MVKKSKQVKKAKKAKKAQVAKKVKKAAKSKASSSAAASVPARTRGTVEVPVPSVVQFVKMLYEQGHAEDFIKAAKEANVSITVHADSADLVRKYVGSKNLRSALAASIDDPCEGHPFECPK